MISIEMARLLAEVPDVDVIGILMIDSYCPWTAKAQTTDPTAPSLPSITSEKVKELTTHSFQHALAMISSWEKPTDFKAAPAAIIKAKEHQMVEEDDGELGWSNFESLRILSVYTVPGNHFTMFSDELVSMMLVQLV